MLPPIKRATLKTQTLLTGRTKLNNPPLFDRHGRKPNPPANQTAIDECKLLELIQQNPGQTMRFFCRNIPHRSDAWMYQTLRGLEEAGVIRRDKKGHGKGSAAGWYLT